jgi:DNA-binding FadR family transcriptional regulator
MTATSQTRKIGKREQDLEVKPIEKIVLIDQIIEIIKLQITEGKIKPGSRIPGERTLSEKFKVSRTSIRQALKALEVLGVLEIRHGSTTTLSQDISHLLINPLKFMSILYNVGISELFDTRKIIEVELAKKAAVNATEEDIHLMARCLETAKKNLDNPEVFLYSEKSFHECIFVASGNRLLTAMIESLNTLLIGSRQESIKTFVNLKDSYMEHYKIFKAIKKRSPELAGKAMLDHLEDVEKRLSTVDPIRLEKKFNRIVIN